MAACSYSPTSHIHFLREWMSDSKDPREKLPNIKIKSLGDKCSLIDVASL
jgi:hypothetical protein